MNNEAEIQGKQPEAKIQFHVIGPTTAELEYTAEASECNEFDALNLASPLGSCVVSFDTDGSQLEKGKIYRVKLVVEEVVG
jgi:hypothetical protein